MSHDENQSVLSKPAVLLVDDDKDQLYIFSEMIKRKVGCEVISADSAEEALDILKNVHVELVVCDVNMPGMNGKDFVRKVRAHKGLKRLSVLSFSASDAYSEEELKRCGSDNHFNKANTVALMTEVNQLLEAQQKNKGLLSKIQERFS